MVPLIALHDLLRRRDPPASSTERDDFGERVHAHDAAVDVHAQERRDERFDEIGVGCGGGDGGRVGAGVGLHLEEEIGFVFEDVEVVFLSAPVDVPPSLFALRCSGWVLPARDGVDEPWSLCAPLLLVPVAEDVVHAVR